MPTIEGLLIRNWREAMGLSQESLGAACRPLLGKNSIHNYETQSSSMSVSNVLRVVKALKVPGMDEAHQLARFFLGPSEAMIEEAIEAQKRMEVAARRSRRSLEQLVGPGRRR